MEKMNNLKSILKDTLIEFWYLPSFGDKYYFQVGFNNHDSLVLKYIYTNNINSFFGMVYLNDIQYKLIFEFLKLDFNIATQKDILIIDGVYYIVKFKSNIYRFECSNIPNEYLCIYNLCEKVLSWIL